MKYQGQIHANKGKKMVLVKHQWWNFFKTKEEANQAFQKSRHEEAIKILKKIKQSIISQTFYEEVI